MEGEKRLHTVYAWGVVRGRGAWGASGCAVARTTSAATVHGRSSHRSGTGVPAYFLAASAGKVAVCAKRVRRAEAGVEWRDRGGRGINSERGQGQ
eukprot:3442202-Pleurochrysis_carterae.AAC.1